MLTRSPTDPGDDLDNGRVWLAAIVALCTAGVLGLVVGRAFRDVQVDLGAAEPTTARGLGDALFGTWVLPFEVLSVLLLSAVVGAIALSRRSPDEPGTVDDDAHLAADGRR